MPHSILLVEDDTTLRETLSYNLQREGYEVREGADGEQALDEPNRTHHGGGKRMTKFGRKRATGSSGRGSGNHGSSRASCPRARAN